jgi:hypothetical protein
MNVNSVKQTNYSNGVSSYVKNHWVSLGLFLAAYGAIYLSSVILNRPAVAELGKVVTIYSPTSMTPLLPRSSIDTLFFVTSFPALIIGAYMLCHFSIRKINPEAGTDKQYVAVLLTAFGFTYQIIGAWPLQNQTDFPWQWQKQIMTYGSSFAWILYILSLAVLAVGGVSLYMHSRIYHQKNPDVSIMEN